MSPLDVLAKAGEVALRYGPDAVKAWQTIEQALRSEHPELRLEVLPDTGQAIRDASAAAHREDP